MYLPPERIAAEPAARPSTPFFQPSCPACGAPLIELRATLRCSQCYLSICEACAGEPASDFPFASD
jgi:hypothetical protein